MEFSLYEKCMEVSLTQSSLYVTKVPSYETFSLLSSSINTCLSARQNTSTCERDDISAKSPISLSDTWFYLDPNINLSNRDRWRRVSLFWPDWQASRNQGMGLIEFNGDLLLYSSLPQNDLELNGFVLIPGPTMRSLMKNFGATDDDLALMESSYFHERLPPDLQPVMKHRKNAFHRVLIDQGTRVNKSCRQ